MPGLCSDLEPQRRRAMALMGEDLYEDLGYEEAEGEAEGFEEFEEEAEGFEEEGFEEGEGFEEEEDGFLRGALGSILGAEEEGFEEADGFEEFEDEMAY